MHESISHCKRIKLLKNYPSKMLKAFFILNLPPVCSPEVARDDNLVCMLPNSFLQKYIYINRGIWMYESLNHLEYIAFINFVKSVLY